jgi:hypothetical protein
VNFAAITLCIPSQRVFIVVYFVIDSVRKHLDTSSHKKICSWLQKNNTEQNRQWKFTVVCVCVCVCVLGDEKEIRSNIKVSRRVRSEGISGWAKHSRIGYRRGAAIGKVGRRTTGNRPRVHTPCATLWKRREIFKRHKTFEIPSVQ